MNDSFTVNGELPLLGAQAISTSSGNVVVQLRCPAGLSMLTGDDALRLAENIRNQLNSVGFESFRVKEWKAALAAELRNKTDEELQKELEACGCKFAHEDDAGNPISPGVPFA